LQFAIGNLQLNVRENERPRLQFANCLSNCKLQITNYKLSMRLHIAWIGKTRDSAIQSLTTEYLRRLARYVPAESSELPSEAALLKLVEKSRPAPTLVVLDSRGKQFSSEELAEFLRRHQDRATPALLFAIGPADGFSDRARAAAALQLSLGKMTLPHELARVVLLEQLYRGFTILKGHPYHLGH
jgi:23S rRNA (pseudouridine1915-N3)-methyltransferase